MYRKRVIRVYVISLALWLCGAPLTGMADDFDGSKTLVCASIDIIECYAGADCRQRAAEDVGAPQFLRINFQEKRIEGTSAPGQEKTTQIERLETRLEKREELLVLQFTRLESTVAALQAQGNSLLSLVIPDTQQS